MDRRPDLHDLLKDLLGTDAVYFQPPSSTELEYPCIVYQRDAAKVEYADNKGYVGMWRYQVTYISRRPDDAVPTTLALLPRCSFVRSFVADKLNHYVYSLYY